MSRSLAKWDRRIERANELAARHPFAAEALSFYARIAGFQKSFYGGLEGHLEGSPGSLRGGLDLSVLRPWFPRYLSLIADIAPPPLARSAAELRSDVLEEFWAGGELPAAESLIAWTFLQPYAERIADQAGPVETQSALCPLCSRRPQVGVLRQLGDGAKRSLICSLCATEWEYRRIVCPACGEEDVNKLPVYTAEDLGHVRVEACDTCRHYIKTVDLTKDGRAVPVVDELAAIPLSLWASENGYTKLSPNLLGL
ncbi:MAG TPA: formate dehydrogenase accessory protein FdhE [Thermoanaerobaculia bacterium]|jgi:FdhE protein|nr:formate dehydrogenase accessory protein FdhE [Thermoanaerobaculia bacterium]